MTALPDYAKGRVPEFDSRWSAETYRARLGRQLSEVQERTIVVAHGLPYRVRTLPGLVGKPRQGLQRAFAVEGPLGARWAERAYLDGEGLPEIE